MAKNKTTETTDSALDFISAVTDEAKRLDCLQLLDLIEQQSGLAPKMWGPSIVGFGSYHYKYESGREGDAPRFAFSPRASSIALYFSGQFENREALLEKLGKHKTDKGCIHVKKLDDISLEVLQQMIANHLTYNYQLYP